MLRLVILIWFRVDITKSTWLNERSAYTPCKLASLRCFAVDQTVYPTGGYQFAEITLQLSPYFGHLV